METLFFLCKGDETFNSEIGTIYNSQLPALVKGRISAGDYYYIDGWSCWNSKFIKVGDKAYLQRSGNRNSDEPSGFIAAGCVVAAPKNSQLRLLDPKYSNLSDAYIFDEEGRFYICLKLDSVVDFDFPLEQQYLTKLPQFQGVNFNFGRGGARFEAKAAAALEAEWEKHSLIQQRQGRGRRLVDVFFERGDKYKQNEEYKAAINEYKLALEVNPNYSKALNRIKVCESILQRNSPSQSKKDSVINFQDKSIDTNSLSDARDELDRGDFFAFPSKGEAQNRILVSIARRQGQTKFRQILLEAYEYKCAITNFDVEAALEAAHIIPYIETGNNNPSNGVLLRADLHTLFDLNLIAIHPETMQTFLHPTLQTTEYRGIHGKKIRIPRSELCRPSQQLLKLRVKELDWLTVV